MTVCVTESTSCSFTRKSPDKQINYFEFLEGNGKKLEAARTGQEAISIGRGADAAVVWIVELQRQQVLETVLFENWRALEEAAVESAQLVGRVLIRSVDPVGVEDARDQIELRPRSCEQKLERYEKNIPNSAQRRDVIIPS